MLPLALLLAIQIAPADAASPYRQPQLAAAGDRVALAYGSGNSVFVTVSPDGGRTFAPPVVVSSKGRLSLGNHRGPRVAFAGDALVATAIVGEKPPGAHGAGVDGDLLAWRSGDGGRTWSAPVRVNDS